MNDDRSLERAARSWLEEGPTRAPDRAVEAALTSIQKTRQDRGLLVPWRMPTVNPAMKLAAAVSVAVVAVAGSLYLLGGTGGFGGRPTPVPTLAPTTAPSPSPTAAAISPSPTPLTGACTLATSEEAERIAGQVGLGAFPVGSASGATSSCLYSDGGGTTALRLRWTSTGGTASFDAELAKAGVESVDGLGDAAAWNPGTATLHVRQGDAHLAVSPGDYGRTLDQRLANARTIAELALPRM